MRMCFVVLAGAVASVACRQGDPHALAPEESRRLAALIVELDGKVKACEAAFAAATSADALAKVAVGDARCDAPLDAPARGGSSTKTLDAKYFEPWTVRRVKGAAPVGAASACNPWRFELDFARSPEASRSTLASLERAAKAKRLGSYEAMVLVSDEKAPVSKGGGAFEPGAVRGRAFVYDYGLGRVVCAGDVDTASSDSVPVRYRYHEMNVLDAEWKRDLAAPKALARDLEAQLRRAIATQLERVR